MQAPKGWKNSEEAVLQSGSLACSLQADISNKADRRPLAGETRAGGMLQWATGRMLG